MARRTPAVLAIAVLAASVACGPAERAPDPRPTVDAVSPYSGPTGGGNAVIVQGTGLDSVTAVYFGRVRAPAVTHVSSTRLRVVAPAVPPAEVHVQVVDPDGRSRPTPPGRYRFVAEPAEFDWHRAPGFDPTALACASSTYCVGGADETLAVFDGATWSKPHEITDTAVPVAQLSCPAVGACAARLGAHAAMVQNDGVWGPPRVIDVDADVTDLSCGAAGSCIAVDSRGAAIEYRDGRWGAPVVIDPRRRLYAVSCPSARFCLAYDNSGREMVYDGSTWTAPLATGMGRVQSLDCVSDEYCVAGIDQFTTGPSVRRHGAWAHLGMPARASGFAGISCGSFDVCVYLTRSDGEQPNLVMDGAAFATTGLHPVDGDEPSADIDCPTVSFCLAQIDGHAYVGTRT